MRDNASSLDSFICYNLALGFSMLFLYADDPEDEAVVVARRYPADRVLLRTHDATLREEWRRLPSWGRLQLYAATEVQARQMLNAEHAMQRSLALGLDFLLHVDSDEFLHLPCAPGGGGGGGEALQAHAALLSQRGALQFTYRNLEAVPEHEVRAMRAVVAAPGPVAQACTPRRHGHGRRHGHADVCAWQACDDPFEDVSLFKQHPAELTLRPASPRLSAAIAHWEEAEGGGGQLFRFYTNGEREGRAKRDPSCAQHVLSLPCCPCRSGKSMVKVDPCMCEAASVHEFKLGAAPGGGALATAALTTAALTTAALTTAALTTGAATAAAIAAAEGAAAALHARGLTNNRQLGASSYVPHRRATFDEVRGSRRALPLPAPSPLPRPLPPPLPPGGRCGAPALRGVRPRGLQAQALGRARLRLAQPPLPRRVVARGYLAP